MLHHQPNAQTVTSLREVLPHPDKGTGKVDLAGKQQQKAHLQTTLDHPPAHQPLRATHQKEEPQILCQCHVNVTPDSKVHSRHCKDKAQCAAPHAVGVLHPVDELELVQAHPPVVGCAQACETAISSVDFESLVSSLLAVSVQQQHCCCWSQAQFFRAYCGACVDL